MSEPRTAAVEANHPGVYRAILPIALWMLASTLLLAPAMNVITADAGQAFLLVLWFANMTVCTARLAVTAPGARRSAARPLSEAVTVGTPDARRPEERGDELVEGVVSLLGPESRAVVDACRARSHALRADAARARSALDGVPAGGEGANALRDAAERADARAAELDDEIARLYARAMADAHADPAAATDALDELRAVVEVDREGDARRRALAARARQTG